jgi:serine/threonine protein kinase
MGEVYRARDPRLDRDVALKILPEQVAADPSRVRRFQTEAKAAGALNHPNILAVHDFGTHEGIHYVVSELLEGETLRRKLDQTSPLPVRKLIEYAAQIARGLAAAHEKGIIHRDLKPENAFVTRDGHVKILDFGLAKQISARDPDGDATRTSTEVLGTEPGLVMGTAGYMSPEQVRGQDADARSDIFSFGILLYEMASGRPRREDRQDRKLARLLGAGKLGRDDREYVGVRRAAEHHPHDRCCHHRSRRGPIATRRTLGIPAADRLRFGDLFPALWRDRVSRVRGFSDRGRASAAVLGLGGNRVLDCNAGTALLARSIVIGGWSRPPSPRQPACSACPARASATRTG